MRKTVTLRDAVEARLAPSVESWARTLGVDRRAARAHFEGVAIEVEADLRRGWWKPAARAPRRPFARVTRRTPRRRRPARRSSSTDPPSEDGDPDPAPALRRAA